jgi:hypothetical protein
MGDDDIKCLAINCVPTADNIKRATECDSHVVLFFHWESAGSQPVGWRCEMYPGAIVHDEYENPIESAVSAIRQHLISDVITTNCSAKFTPRLRGTGLMVILHRGK